MSSASLDSRTWTSRSFTLIELMVTIAIVAILLALAVPNMLKFRQTANESAAMEYMRQWHQAQERYRMTHGVYATSDEALISEKLISKKSAAGNGYTFAIENPDGKYTWFGRATPQVEGLRHFYIDMSGVVRHSATGPASANSPPVQDG